MRLRDADEKNLPSIVQRFFRKFFHGEIKFYKEPPKIALEGKMQPNFEKLNF
jgi:hypothetical protein